MRRRKIHFSKKKRSRAIVRLTIIFMIVIAVVFASNAAISSGLLETTSEENKALESGNNREIIIRSGENEIESAVLAPILDYFKVSTDALADLKSTDLTGLFEDSTSENAQINQAALDYLINLRLNQSNDLHMTNYLVGLSIDDVSKSDGVFEVTITEDQTVNFSFVSNIDSSSSGISHTFFIEKSNNGYAIAEHTKEEDVFLMIQEATDEFGYSERMIDELSAEESSVVAELAAAKKEYNSTDETTTADSPDNSYSSEKAVDYAMTWVDPVEVIRNEDDYSAYDDYGGNCNNFISQCLIAGGIPMDYFGDIDTQWKWYGETVDLDETNRGRSPAWAGVAEFYTYASENTGYGLEAMVGDNVFSGSAGDILQYGNNGEWVHSVIITEVVKDDQGNVLDYLINSNTTDRINYPASAYGYSDLRLIKILGWNKK
ncbi:MAG: amidase domain-containing protein [Acetobacterium sp.]